MVGKITAHTNRISELQQKIKDVEHKGKFTKLKLFLNI